MKRFSFLPVVQTGFWATLCAGSLLVAAGCDPKPAADTSATTAPTAAPSASAPAAEASPVAGMASPSPSGSSTDGGKMIGPPGPDAAKNSAGKIVTTASGLKYQDIKIGTGATPQPGQTVLVHYTGTLQDGTKFDSSRDRGEPFPFALGQKQVIPGWDEGIASMKVGGQRKLIIPADLAYGANSPSPLIPANSTLLFDVELVGIQ